MSNLLGGGLWPATEDSSLLWLLLALPLAGALLCGLVGGRLQRRFGRGAASAVAVTMMIATTGVALVVIAGALLPLPPERRCLQQSLWPLFQLAGVEVTFGLTLDALSATMTLVVTIVGTLIHLYAAGYMKAEPSLARFFAYLNLFVFSMLLLVLADGFVPLLFGWEGVGVCSYLLIGFWFRRPVATAAATKAFIVNRVGDWAFLTGICVLLWGLAGTSSSSSSSSSSLTAFRPAAVTAERLGPTLAFRALAQQLTVEYGPRGDDGRGGNPHGRPFADALAKKSFAGVPLLFVVCLLFFLGAAGKSAQVPLFAWLPDAMAGPTPVSALIHAATMVTAGIYLMARLAFLFALSPGALTVVAVVGALTALVGATAGCLQWDLKRVLAYSTISQLGFMFVAVGAGAFQAGIFHVVTHACFKACLFLAAGSVIHAVNHIESGESSDPQDMRNMGGLAAALPWTRRGYLIACLAIAGFPVASGFYSKDQILSAVATSGLLQVSPVALLAVLFLITALTAFYMFRSYYLMFFSRPARPEPPGRTHEPSRRMTAVVLILAAASLMVGPALGWPRHWIAGDVSPVLERFLAPVFAASAALLPFRPETALVGGAVQLGGLAFALAGFLAARVLYRDSAGDRRLATWRTRMASRGPRLQRWIAGGWGFDDLYHHLAVLPARDFARAAAWLDHRVFDRAVNGVGSLGMVLARLVGRADHQLVDGTVRGARDAVLVAGRRVAALQSGRISGYLLGATAGIAVFAILAYLLGS